MTTPSTPEASLSAGTLAELYETDFHLWLTEMVTQLKTRQLDNLDLPHIIEELESIGRRDRQALQSNLQVVLIHLLKYQFQPQKRSNSWRYTLLEHRDRIEVLLEDSPSLYSYLGDRFEACYTKARRKAAAETVWR